MIHTPNAPVQFRDATLADIGAMSAIRLAVRENALTDPKRVTVRMYEDYLDRLGHGWVGTVNGKVVGFSYAAKQDNTIWALFVAPECEGRGVGAALLKLAANWLFQSGAGTVSLCTAANTRADRFYSAQGWRRGDMENATDVIYTMSQNY
jgi:GNAT superfamily N-acetyltransferase